MITNFNEPDNFKKQRTFNIPPKPNLINSFEIVRLATLYFCTASLFFYSHFIIALFILLLSLYLTTFFIARIIITIAIKQYINLIKKVQKIYYTPTMTENGSSVFFNFISPSDILLKKIHSLDKALNIRKN
jgi:hypothetical protein